VAGRHVRETHEVLLVVFRVPSIHGEDAHRLAQERQYPRSETAGSWSMS
jgi:hypothetical protein